MAMARSLGDVFSRTGTNLPDQITSKIDSYTPRSSDANQSVVFDNSDEEVQPGLVDWIRLNAHPEDINADEVTSIEESSTGHASIGGSSIQNSTSDYLDREKEEQLSIDSLKKKLRHIFIVSANGKPVFSRYGDEEHMVTLMGVMQTLVAFTTLTDSGDLYYLKAGPSRVAFLRREQLVFVIVCHSNEAYSSLVQQLHYVYYQVISTLTLTRIQQRFKNQPNFDLRRWFSQAEKGLIHHLLHLYESDLGLFMKSVRCLMLPQPVREKIGQCVLQVVRKQAEMPFILIFIENQLVFITKLKRYHLQPSDMYLLINLVHCSEIHTNAEAWIPLCLPRFDPGGTLHAHVSYLDSERQISLVLLTVNPEDFPKLSSFKHRIAEKLQNQDLISKISEAHKNSTPLDEEIRYDGLRYFIYKLVSKSQIVSSDLDRIYTDSEQQVRLLEQIRSVYARFHQESYPLKYIVYSTGVERIYACVTPKYELYAVFAPSVPGKVILSSVERILSYIDKEETDLFIFECECIASA